MFQSTHSRGVRHRQLHPKTDYNSFNPRTHEECDMGSTKYTIMGDQFQSTHSRGVRRVIATFRVYQPGFNPRTHEECDIFRFPYCYTAVCFNPRTHEECDISILKL